MFNPKALLLINNNKTQIRKLNIFGEETVCSNNNINLSLFKFFQSFILLFFTTKTTKYININRIVIKSLCKISIMLLSKDCCWYQNSYLFMIFNRFESSSHSYLCLTKTNIANKQTIHRFVVFHVMLDFHNRTQLVFCFNIGKIVIKFTLQVVIWRKGKSLQLTTFRI